MRRAFHMTKRLYYEDQYLKEFKSKVVNFNVDFLVIEETAFYPGGGGQPYDKGYINGEGWSFKVEGVFEKDDEIVHKGVLEGREPNPGDPVRGVIDWERRYRLMRMHTAAHILGYAVKKLYGLEVGYHGGMLSINESHQDFTARIPRGDLPKLEDVVRTVIKNNLKVKAFWLLREEAKRYIEPFGEHLTELHEGIKTFRIVEIEGIYAVPCGGTHVSSTGEVGEIKLLKRESKGKGITRIRYTII